MATSGSFKILGDSLRQHPERLFKTQAEGLKLLYKGNAVYAGVRLNEWRRKFN